jgi:hypothetical protein
MGRKEEEGGRNGGREISARGTSRTQKEGWRDSKGRERDHGFFLIDGRRVQTGQL